MENNALSMIRREEGIMYVLWGWGWLGDKDSLVQCETDIDCMGELKKGSFCEFVCSNKQKNISAVLSHMKKRLRAVHSQPSVRF